MGISVRESWGGYDKIKKEFTKNEINTNFGIMEAVWGNISINFGIFYTNLHKNRMFSLEEITEQKTADRINFYNQNQTYHVKYSDGSLSTGDIDYSAFSQ